MASANEHKILSGGVVRGEVVKKPPNVPYEWLRRQLYPLFRRLQSPWKTRFERAKIDPMWRPFERRQAEPTAQWTQPGTHRSWPKAK